jgi:CheY-like chemotaxis protein
MNPDQWLKLIGVAVSLISACVWPAIIIFIIIYFRTPIRKFLDNMSEMSVKVGDVEATVKRQIEFATFSGAAIAIQKKDRLASDDLTATANSASSVAQAAIRDITPSSLKRLSGANALWVDDKPSNNIYERRALQALGIHVTTSTSSHDALQQLQSNNFDVVISDMSRPEDPEAGYTLLSQQQKLRNAPPFIIYTGSSLPEHQSLALSKGAWASTSDPQELFQAVIDAIQLRRPA